MLRNILTFAVLITLASASIAAASDKPAAALYKTPQCGCCESYADYLRENGYSVTVHETEELGLFKREHGVGERFEGCHTTLIDGYVVEGHVPLDSLERMLNERPNIRGISLPGMPQGSPGMSGQKTEPFTIYEIGEGTPKIFAVE